MEEDVPDDVFETELGRLQRHLGAAFQIPVAFMWIPVVPDPEESFPEETTAKEWPPFDDNEREDRKKAGLCPECGRPGEWVNMAMRCKKHGNFIG